MRDSAKEYFSKVMTLYGDWQKRHIDFMREMEQCKDIKELADMVYAMRKIADMMEDMHKRTRGAYELSGRLVCLLWAQGDDADPIRTEHCTITPKIKIAAVLPKKGTDEYKQLMTEYFKVPIDLVDIDAIRPHWPGVTDMLTEAATRGLPMPAGIDPAKTYHVYTVLIKSKKGVTE